MSRVGPSQMIFPLQVGLGDLKVMQRHMGTFVAEQLHDGGQGDAGAEHLRGICVSKLVRDNARCNSNSGGRILKCGTELERQHVAATPPGQKQPSGMGSIRWAQRTDSLYQLTDQGIHRNPAFGFEFAKRYMDGPLVRADGAQAIYGEIDAFADAHAGMAEK